MPDPRRTVTETVQLLQRVDLTVPGTLEECTAGVRQDLSSKENR